MFLKYQTSISMSHELNLIIKINLSVALLHYWIVDTDWHERVLIEYKLQIYHNIHTQKPVNMSADLSLWLELFSFSL